MFNITQIVLVCLFVWGMTFIGWSMQLFVYGVPVLYGAVIGLIMGDVTTGLTVGGTLTLMSLGIGGWGGSSVPDYALGTVAGTLFAIASGQGLETGLVVGIPVAALGTQFDILAKMSGSFFVHKQMEVVDKKEFNKMGLWVHGWTAFRATMYTLPVLFAMTIGAEFITSLLNSIPTWLMDGLNVAAGILPAVGFAILLKYMPMRKYGIFVVLGFVLTAYLDMPMLGVSLITLVAAVLIYQNLERESVLIQGGNEDE
ncbi:MAG: PTS mannose/fructose/sorbose/N-acetylgalactosamine transporter subunit IIC [Anaerorhabdus sp.]